MRTFKIQPRNPFESLSACTVITHQKKEPVKKRVQTPSSHKGKIREEAEMSEKKSYSPTESGRPTRQRNKSLIDNPHTQTLLEMRVLASECSAYLDNEIFRLRTESDLQTREVLTVFEDLCQRMARKLNYLKNYIEQQMAGVFSKITLEKARLDSVLEKLDTFLEEKPGSATLQDVLTIRSSLTIENKELVDQIVFPRIADPEELLETFGALLEGHIWRKEVDFDCQKVKEYNKRIFECSGFKGSVIKAMENHQRTKQKSVDAEGRHKIFHPQTVLQQVSSLENNSNLGNKLMALEEITQAAVNKKQIVFPSGLGIDPLVKKLSQKPQLDSQTQQSSEQMESTDQLFPKESLDLECHENMEAILPRPITHIEEQEEDTED